MTSVPQVVEYDPDAAACGPADHVFGLVQGQATAGEQEDAATREPTG
jgi:hypothetical protein